MVRLPACHRDDKIVLDFRLGTILFRPQNHSRRFDFGHSMLPVDRDFTTIQTIVDVWYNPWLHAPIYGVPKVNETDVRTVSEWLVANGASPNVELLATGDYLVARFHDKSQALRVMRTATTALPALVEIVTRADPDALSLPADLEVAAAKPVRQQAGHAGARHLG